MIAGTRQVRIAGEDDRNELEALERTLRSGGRAAASIESGRPGARDVAAIRAWVCRGTDGTLEGFVSARVLVDELEIVDVGVRSDRRRTGVATELLRTVLREAARSGARRAVLEVAESNRAARSLYERLGFRPCGRRPGYYRSGAEDALVLEVAIR